MVLKFWWWFCRVKGVLQSQRSFDLDTLPKSIAHCLNIPLADLHPPCRLTWVLAYHAADDVDLNPKTTEIFVMWNITIFRLKLHDRLYRTLRLVFTPLNFVCIPSHWCWSLVLLFHLYPFVLFFVSPFGMSDDDTCARKVPTLWWSHDPLRSTEGYAPKLLNLVYCRRIVSTSCFVSRIYPLIIVYG